MNNGFPEFCTVLCTACILSYRRRNERTLEANRMRARPSSGFRATLSCWIFQPLRHRSSASFAPSAILVLFPSAVAKPAAQLHETLLNDIVTRQYSTDSPNPAPPFHLLLRTVELVHRCERRHLWTAGEERVCLGKAPRRIIGKRSEKSMKHGCSR